jgi:hypothetical protein
MRKITILITALIFGIGIMAYLYFSKLSDESNNNDLAIKAASQNACLVFSYHNDKSFYQIIEGQDLLQKIIGGNKSKLLNDFKRSIMDNDILFSATKNQPIYLSLIPDEANTLNLLITAETTIDKSFSYFEKQLKQQNIEIQKLDSIYSAKLNDSNLIYFYVKDKLFTASNSAKLVKQSISNNKTSDFSKFIVGNNNTRTNVLATLFVNFEAFPSSLKKILNTKIDGNLTVLNKQKSFAVLNYNFSKEKILFNGNTEIVNANNYIKLFENIEPQEITITNLLPENTANYTVYAFDDYKKWAENLNNWLKNIKQKNTAQQLIKNIKEKYRVDLNAIFPVYSKNQFINFQLNTGEKLGAIYLSNGEKVKQLLIDISENYTEEIKIFKPSDILFGFYGEPFKKFIRPYYIVKDNYLIFASNASTIQSFLNQYTNNKILIKTPEYADAMNELSNTSNVMHYINFKNSSNLFRNTLYKEYYNYFNTTEGVKYFDSFYYQMSADKNKFTTNLLINKYLETTIPDSTSIR